MDIIQSAEKFIRDRLANEGTGHDWWHVERVRATARHIQQTEGGDETIIDLALLLHDVGDREVINKDEDDYSIAENFLSEQFVDTHTIQKIMDIIKNMSYSKSLDGEVAPDSIEFQIVQDADRLDAVGAIGIARAFAFGGSRGRLLFDPENEAVQHASCETYINSNSSTLHHFDEKLFHLKDRLNTKTALAIAHERDTYMHEFYDRFIHEWYGRK